MSEPKESSVRFGRIRSDAIERSEVAHTLPFFLRAWWLRDRDINADVVIVYNNVSSLPLWSSHSDPFCDATTLDVFGV